jgi:hypothetical protein
MPTRNFSNEILKAAIVGFEAQKRQIDAKIAELRAILTARAEPGKQPTFPARRLSAEGRRRIIASPKRRVAVARKKGAAARKRKTSGTSGTGPRVGREAEAE